MTNLQRRLAADRLKRVRREWLAKALKTAMRKVFTFFVAFAVLLAMAQVPAVHAFFTAKAESEPVEVQVKTNPASKNTSASFMFNDSFLLGGGTDKSGDSGEEVRMTSLQGFDMEDEGFAMFLVEEEPAFCSGEIEAYIWFEGDFDAGDAYLPSIRLHYGGESTEALSGRMEEDKLLVAFDRNVMASWFDGGETLSGEAAFLITGQGYTHGMYPFDFTGTATLMLDGSYEIVFIAIEGEEDLFLPPLGEASRESYRLLDQDGNILKGAVWELKSPYPGVAIDSAGGELTIQGSAPGGTAVIQASLDSEGRTLVARKPVNLHIQPNLEIEGPQQIFIPGDDGDERASYHISQYYPVDSIEIFGSTAVQIPLLEGEETLYQAQVRDDRGRLLPWEPLLWSLDTEHPGVSLAGTGALTVDPLAREGQVTLVAVSETNPDISGTLTVSLLEELKESHEEPLIGEKGPVAEDVELDNVQWSLADRVEGVHISASGVLTVTGRAAAGTITLKARAEAHGLPVAVERKIALEFPPAATVEISGSSRLTIPPEGEIHESYHALVRDEEGRILEGEAVVWSMDREVSGIELSQKGELKVSSRAEAGSVTLRAACLSHPHIVGRMTVTLEKRDPQEEPPAEEEPQEEIPPEEPPAEVKPGEEPPAEEPPTEVKPGEDPPVEEPPAEVKPDPDPGDGDEQEEGWDERAKEEEGVDAPRGDEVKETEGETP